MEHQGLTPNGRKTAQKVNVWHRAELEKVVAEISDDSSNLLYLLGDGNYTIFMLKNGDKRTFSKTLSYIEALLSRDCQNVVLLRLSKGLSANFEHCDFIGKCPNFTHAHVKVEKYGLASIRIDRKKEIINYFKKMKNEDFT